METLELKLQNNVSQSEANKISTSHKNIDRLIMANDGSGLKIFLNNEFIPLQAGDYLYLNNTLIAVSQTENTHLPPPTELIAGKTVPASYVEYADVHVPMNTLNNHYHKFDVDTLLKEPPIVNDPLGFLFQGNTPIGIPALEFPVPNHSRQPLPLLKQHFDTQRVSVLSAENNKPQLDSEITVFETKKTQGNILQELGLSAGKQDGSTYSASEEIHINN